MQKKLSCVAISDTHERHSKLKIPPCDILFHSGDFCQNYNPLYAEEQSIEFLEWFANQPARRHVLIAGNHDFLTQSKPDVFKRFADDREIDYLEDEEVVIEDYKIYGSPWQPWFYDWAWNKQRDELADIWALIPDDTDVLLTHGPPRNILDSTFDKRKVGCDALYERVLQVKPQVHIFGHIHESKGMKYHEGITFINAATTMFQFELLPRPEK